jgi:tetratricopeptide (TPR) repeat protein
VRLSACQNAQVNVKREDGLQRTRYNAAPSGWEIPMNKPVLLTAAAALAIACSSPIFGMGGGGGGMMGGGYGGGGHGMANTEDDYSTAVRLIHREKYADAIPYLNRSLAERPHSANTLSYLGYTHRMLGDYPGSLDYYQRALAIDPDHKGAHEYLGELYLMMHDSSSANAQLAELTRLCPDSCDEKDALTKALADYHASAQAATTQTSATTTTPAPSPAQK